MRAVFFEESNSNNENGDLPCYQYDGGVICCWKSTLVERVRLLFTGRIWVSVLGSGVPPMLLTTMKPLRRYRIAVDKNLVPSTPRGVSGNREVVMLPDWRGSKGAKRERRYAAEIGKSVEYYESLIKKRLHELKEETE